MTLLTLALHPITAPVGARADAGPSHRPDQGSIGIGLAEIPVNRMDDPRAHVYIDDHVNPGTTFTRRLQVTSSSRKTQHLRLYAGAADIKNRRFTFSQGATGNELSSWIKLNHSRVDLRPHGTAPVKVTFTVPAWAAKGEQYAVIWAEVSSTQPGPKTNIALTNRVGIRTYLDIGPGGDPRSAFEISQVHAERSPHEHDQVVATVTNTGRRAIDLSGELQLTDGPSSLDAGPFPVTRGTTLMPQDHGQITVPVGKDLPDGPWKYRLTVQSGRVTHTATGELAFAKDLRTAGLLGSLMRLPVPLALALAGGASAGLIFFVLLLRRFRTRKPKSELRDAQRS